MVGRLLRDVPDPANHVQDEVIHPFAFPSSFTLIIRPDGGRVVSHSIDGSPGRARRAGTAGG